MQKIENNTENTLPGSQAEHCKNLVDEKNRKSETTDFPNHHQILDFPPHCLPAGIDYDVFNQLPRDIKDEIMSIQKTERNSAALKEGGLDETRDPMRPAPLDSASTHQMVSSICEIPSISEKAQAPLDCCASTSRHNSSEATEDVPGLDSAGSVDLKSSPAQPQPSCLQTCVPEGQKHPDDGKTPVFLLPPTVDPKTFSELPPAMQKELLVEWKSQDPVSKIHASKAPDKPRKKKKGGSSFSPQSNSLLRYFKPN